MPAHPYPHSMTTLKAMVEDPPPLVPQPACDAARAAYDRLVRIHPMHTMEVEDAIIAFGRVLWPYRKAFEALIRQALTPEHHGAMGSMNAGVPHAERGAHCAALLEARVAAEGAVRSAIAADDREYRRLIREFQAIQHELDQHIAALRRLAERTVDHPEVTVEILETVRTFERGFATLAREPEAREVCAATEAYGERHGFLRERALSASRPKIFG